jgi:hypothetical protein
MAYKKSYHGKRDSAQKSFLALCRFDFLSVDQEFGADARALLHGGNLRTWRGPREERHLSLMGPISEKPAA